MERDYMRLHYTNGELHGEETIQRRGGTTRGDTTSYMERDYKGRNYTGKDYTEGVSYAKITHESFQLHWEGP